MFGATVSILKNLAIEESTTPSEVMLFDFVFILHVMKEIIPHSTLDQSMLQLKVKLSLRGRVERMGGSDDSNAWTIF